MPATSSGNCWRLRYPIPKIAAAGTPVLIGEPHPTDPTEHTVIVGAQFYTLPAYYLNPPATDGWRQPPKDQR